MMDMFAGSPVVIVGGVLQGESRSLFHPEPVFSLNFRERKSAQRPRDR